MYVHKTKGTCSTSIEIDVDGDIVKSVKFHRGCSGNAQGIARLVAGRNVDEVISILKGIKCQGNTSCPDQLAIALEMMKQG